MKRCPKCGRSYEDYWQVCLEDGVHLIDMKTIHKTHGAGTFKSLSAREAEEEWRQVLLVFLAVSSLFSGFIYILVLIFSGNPFTVITYHTKVSFVSTFLYNAGAFTGIWITSIIFAIPVSILWWRR